MSAAEGTKAFNNLLKEALAKSRTYQALQKNFRQKLNTENLHILDISNTALAVNASTEEQKARFPTSYKLFLDTIEGTTANLTKYNSLKELKEADPAKLSSKETIYIRFPALLICSSFKSARDFVTNKISRAIPSDEFFGITNRARKIDELRGEGYEVFPINPDNPNEGWRIRSERSGKLRTAPRYFDNEGYELLDKNWAFRKTRELSNLDLGHLYTKGPQDAPLGFKLSRVLNVRSISAATKTIVDNAITELLTLEAEVGFKYENNLPKGLAAGGVLVLTLEFYKVNGAKAAIETAIYNKVKADIINEVRNSIINIPGSNTMAQDAAEILRQTLIASISGSSKKPQLPKHDVVRGTTKDTAKAKKVSTGNQALSIGTKPKAGKVGTSVSTKQTYSLASLQLLINTHLQDVISANMGSGNDPRILNYQTGRFAASAKVERMSQSREGMITAFYSYMKNPYQTFEPGYRQGSPKTRDPKLLIAGSIREIAASKVGNRMRAVLL